MMSRLQLAIEQIVFARNYTIGLLDQTPTPSGFDSLRAASATSPGRWATSPSPSTAWRLAHSWAERPEDEALFSPEFKRLFGADSVPQRTRLSARRNPGGAGPGA